MITAGISLTGVLAATVLAMTTSVGSLPGGTLNDELAVREAVKEFYVKGLQDRDFSLIRSICIPDAVLMGVPEDGGLHVTTLDEWSKRFDPTHPPFMTLEHSIPGAAVAGTAAQVKAVFVVDDAPHMMDFLNLLQLNGRWRKANIIDY